MKKTACLCLAAQTGGRVFFVLSLIQSYLRRNKYENEETYGYHSRSGSAPLLGALEAAKKDLDAPLTADFVECELKSDKFDRVQIMPKDQGRKVEVTFYEISA